MIGDNLNTIATAEDALAFAATIAALRAEIDATEAEYRPHLAVLEAAANEYRGERDGKTAPLTARMESLRENLAAWLKGDPDQQLKDNGRVVATLAKAKATVAIDAAKVPDEYKSLKPDAALINAALALKKVVPGVTVTKNYTLRVTT